MQEPTFVRVIDIYTQFENRANTDPVYGETLKSLIRAHKALLRNNAPRQEINQALDAVLNDLNRHVFVVPCRFEPAQEFRGDREIHCTEYATKKINIDSIVTRGRDLSIAQMNDMLWPLSGNSLSPDYDWWDIGRIAGSEGYRFDRSGSGRRMTPITATIPQGMFLLCFTGIDQVIKVYGQRDDQHIVLFTFSEIVNLLRSVEELSGFIINPDTDTHSCIDKNYFRM